MAQAVADVPGGGAEACDRLLTLLAELDAAGDEERGRAAVQLLATAPEAVVAVDHHAKRSHVSAIYLQIMAERTGPIPVALSVRAVARLGGAGPDRFAALLRDPAAAVVRDAATALRPFTGRLPDRLPWDLLTDGRPEVRRAGYRLLNGGPPLVRLRAALTLAIDPVPDLARRGHADATYLARAATDAWARRRLDGELTLTAAERADLDLLAARAAERLGERTSGLLREWLSR